jgi:Rad3-related DNA helicase
MTTTLLEIEENLDRVVSKWGIYLRSGQKEVITDILNSFLLEGKKFYVLAGAVGSGKSYIGYTVSKYLLEYDDFVEDCLFVTNGISLAEQYQSSFDDMPSLKSASNYECNLPYLNKIPVANKVHMNCKYPRAANKCSYEAARGLFKHSPIRTLNSAFYLTGINVYNTSGLLVLDEAHNLEMDILEGTLINSSPQLLFNEIRSIAPETLTDKSIQDSILSLNNPKTSKPLLNYVTGCSGILEDRKKTILETISNLPSGSSNQMVSMVEKELIPIEDRLNAFNNYAKILSYYISDNDLSRWIVELTNDRVMIRPIILDNLTTQNIFNSPRYTLIMTATAFDVPRGLRIPKDSMTYSTPPYQYPIENRLFNVITGLGKINKSTLESVIPEYAQFVEAIYNQHDKGTCLTHTVSYANAEALHKCLGKDISYLVTLDDLKELPKLLENHSGKILLTPSATEGLDFNNNSLSCSIIFKIPYKYLGDDLIKAKVEYSKQWYDLAAMVDIIQSSGRGVRDENDVSPTYILDPSFGRLLRSTRAELPVWFLDSINYL